MAGHISVMIVVMLTIVTQVKYGQSSDCIQFLKPLGGIITFTYQNGKYLRVYDLRFMKDNNLIIDDIYRILGTTGIYMIMPSYEDRVSIYGDMMHPLSVPWNISISMTNVTRGDEGLYRLESSPDDLSNATFCLYILDTPGPIVRLDTHEKGHTYVLKGASLILNAQPAVIIANNDTQYSVTMSWLLEDKTLKTDGSFLVYPDRLVIWSVPVSLHGTTLTYRATVDGTDVMTEADFRLFVVYMEIHFNTSQTMYAVKTGEPLPDILCEVMTSAEVEDVEITWIGNGQVITNDNILILGKAELTMSGEYNCIATLPITGQQKERSVFITVYEQAHMEIHFNTSQTMYVVKTGEPLPDILCEAMTNSDIEDVEITWTQNGQVITNDTILILGKAELTMSGEYRCVATMPITGQRKERSVFITVYEQAHLDIHLNTSQTMYAVKTGELLPDILCEVMANSDVEDVEITWTQNGQVITNDTILILGKAELTMSGEYRCIATLTITGQRKERSVFITVYEQALVTEVLKQSSATSIALSTIGLVTSAVVMMVVLLFYIKNKLCNKDHNKGDVNTDARASTIEMPSYTNLRFETRDKLYDQLEDSACKY